MTIVILIVALAVLLIAGAIAFSRRRTAQLEGRRTAAAAHRDEAVERSRSAEQADLAAHEQSARAERERLEAAALAEDAGQERVAAAQHREQARDIDPDIGN
jgi:biopolymer transport protein ExbB/TolQ